MLKILVTSAGSASALNCINALRNQTELQIELISSDLNELAAGLYLADSHYLVPTLSNEEAYISALLKICRDESVNVLLPTASREMPTIAKYADEFRANNVGLCISPVSSIRLFGNKWESFLFLDHNQFPTPPTWQLPDFEPDTFPVHVKPIIGSGAQYNRFIANETEFQSWKKGVAVDEFIMQPHLDAPEYSVDVLVGNDNEILALVPRERIRTSNGLSIVTRTVADNSIAALVEGLLKRVKLVGPLNIQYFRTANGQYFIFDINTRFAAGGLPLTIRASGVNFPLETVRLALGLPVKAKRDYVKNLMMIRYYTEVFVEGSV